MISFGVANVRRLRDVPAIEIRPITILVGRNSSGKSTFLRSFPLIRQSLMTRTSSPILWYGDLVDFGSYETTVSDNDKRQNISFFFTVDPITGPEMRTRDWLGIGASEDLSQYFSKANYQVTIEPLEHRNKIKTLDVTFRGAMLNFKLQVGESGTLTRIQVNGHHMTELPSDIALAVAPGAIFPEMQVVRQSQPQVAVYSYWAQERIPEMVEGFISPHLNPRAKADTKRQLAYTLLSMGMMPRDDMLARAERTGNRSWDKYVRSISAKDREEFARQLQRVTALGNLPWLFNVVTRNLRLIMGGILYIGPARARSERYYRYQDLAVSEIDPDGKNFPMFLNSLPASQVKSLSRWVERLFGYGLALSRPEGHISINLVEGNVESNIVDTGYGVSQILPVLAQVWWARERRRPTRSNTSILAIEQPELHLHPAHQALLADALVGEAQSTATAAAADRVHFLIETHSETFINRLGELISDKKIRPKDVHIVLFEASTENDRETTVSVVGFDESGSLINWPFGFFQPKVG
ncbi:MAG: hypothetical protein QOG66_2217 [Methylobacteriaceae bacterium]|jgi:predicted ATPase|nr:hypothetical protein [Methylobacteriaceae bacterium]